MLGMILRLQLLLSCLLIHFIYAVDFDYYFSALRSKKSCDNMTEKMKCQVKCGMDTGMCFGSECYCLTVTTFKKDMDEEMKKVVSKIVKRHKDGQSHSNYYDYSELPEDEYEVRKHDAEESPQYLHESLLDDKPVLRHHIAHFCPNLEVARTCIRTCMSEGKPAFCGKDHVCYCGHKYSNKDINSEVDATNMYAQFKDLYEKYFGPGYYKQSNLDV